MKKLKFNPKKINIAVLAVIIVTTGIFLYTNRESTNDISSNVVATDSEIALKPETIDQTASQVNTSSQNDLLLYLVEEEKLAHDVYTKMYELYGARVFGNILKSESTHQSRVLSLLEVRDIADPRSSEVGVFNNQDLQNLYDTLIAQGIKNAEEAYKVGVAIEEKDIADITKQLATATDSDIVLTLEDLRNGSENHLRAFNRQLNKY